MKKVCGAAKMFVLCPEKPLSSIRERMKIPDKKELIDMLEFVTDGSIETELGLIPVENHESKTE